VIPSLARKAIGHPEEKFVVWGSGSQGRAFLHVDDVVAALISAMDKGLGRRPIQIGPDVCTPIREIAEAIVDISGKDIEINYDESKPEGDRGRKADYSRARKLLGWEPRIATRDGLESLYPWIEQEIHRNKIEGKMIGYCKN
jgi:nucleoside-diphosphate-sugar epimerase